MSDLSQILHAANELACQRNALLNSVKALLIELKTFSPGASRAEILEAEELLKKVVAL
jgi:hypothetical protein